MPKVYHPDDDCVVPPGGPGYGFAVFLACVVALSIVLGLFSGA